MSLPLHTCSLSPRERGGVREMCAYRCQIATSQGFARTVRILPPTTTSPFDNPRPPGVQSSPSWHPPKEIHHIPKPRRNIRRITALIFLCALTGCAAQATPTVRLQFAANADVGKSIRSDQWETTLLDAPYKDEIVGDEEQGENEQMGYVVTDVFIPVAQEPDGIWLILPVRITNIGESENAFLPGGLHILDDQGREIPVGGRLVHSSAIWIHDPDRWGSDENQLLPSFFLAQQAREGPAVFDVPLDATGLKLAMKGSDETIDLGF